MAFSELILIKQIFSENPISHSVKYNNNNKPINIYTVSAHYETEKNTIHKRLLTVAYTPYTGLFEVSMDDKYIYAQYYNPRASIGISKQTELPTESDIIGNIITICREKTEKHYVNQLKEIQIFLNKLKQQKQQE